MLLQACMAIKSLQESGQNNIYVVHVLVVVVFNTKVVYVLFNYHARWRSKHFFSKPPPPPPPPQKKFSLL
jgi:hypothetical protein